MTVIVVDASVLVVGLADSRAAGDLVRSRLAEEELAAPDLVDLEVLSVLRRHAATGAITPERAERAVEDLMALPLHRQPHTALLPRCWQLRATVTAYDAAYVALAEALDGPLVTADARLARAPGIRCAVELVTT